VICEATPTTIALAGSADGPLVCWRQPGLEQRCPARFASASITVRGKSSRTHLSCQRAGFLVELGHRQDRERARGNALASPCGSITVRNPISLKSGSAAHRPAALNGAPGTTAGPIHCTTTVPETGQDARAISHRPRIRTFSSSQDVSVRAFAGRVGRGALCHTRATRGGRQRSMWVTPDHSWPQVKAWTREALEGSQAPNQTQAPPAVLTPGWPLRPGPDSGGSPKVRVSHHVGAIGVAGRGAGVQIVQPKGAPSGPLPLDPLRDELADATGYPLLSSPTANQHPACAISVPLPPVNHGQ
jgi:hypothetical protein